MKYITPKRISKDAWKPEQPWIFHAAYDAMRTVAERSEGKI